MTAENQLHAPPYKSFQDVEQQIMTDGTLSSTGLDMRPTILWYQTNRELIQQLLSSHLSKAGSAQLPEVVQIDQVQLSQDSLARIVGLFPSQAQGRSIATRIQGNPSLWFHKDSTNGPKPTAEEVEKLSPTAIIPSYVGYSRNDDGKLEAEIMLYHVPEDAVEDEEVAKLILAEGAVHEYFHTLTAGLLYSDDHLRLVDGTIVNGHDFIMTTFQALAQAHGPISHYSSFYRDENNHFTGTDKRTAVSEELVEAGTTHLLGFGSGSFVDIPNDPFKDRREIRHFLDDFLYAELVSAQDIEAQQLPVANPTDLAQAYLNLRSVIGYTHSEALS